MRHQFRLYRRKKSGRYYIQNDLTGKQESLHTSDRATATRLLHAKNEARQQPALNLQIAKAYLAATDESFVKRTWREVMSARRRHWHLTSFLPLRLGGACKNGWLSRTVCANGLGVQCAKFLFGEFSLRLAGRGLGRGAFKSQTSRQDFSSATRMFHFSTRRSAGRASIGGAGKGWQR